MSRLPFAFRCASCETTADVAHDRIPVSCPQRHAGDDGDHVLRRVMDASRLSWPAGDDVNPFLRYRRLLSSWHLAEAGGLDDATFVALGRWLDDAILSVDQRAMAVTPFAAQDRLGEAAGLGRGRLWVKDETNNVSGSHKARHLVGLMLHLLVGDRLTAETDRAAIGSSPSRTPLAIASCGNAALAAAIVARAARWPLRVFVPPTADAGVLARLRSLGADIVTCARRSGERGDPCYLRFHEGLGSGGYAFCCQGADNGLTIEGGETLAWEMVDALEGAVPDRIVVQVGGGALASAIAQGFADAKALGRTRRLPRLHTVQSTGGYPLARAYTRVARWIVDRIDPENRSSLAPALAEKIARRAPGATVGEAMAFARTHRSRFMWPWETEPQSVARGILDDEAYDWAVVVEAMLETGGWPIVVDEEALLRANGLARVTTGIDVDHTGTAGLAGLLHLIDSGAIGPDERVAVVFSGARR